MNEPQRPGERPGIEVTIVYEDTDLIEVSVLASNGRFSGLALAYASPDAVREFADLIAGFPRSPADRRAFTFGSFDPAYANGAASLELSCKDAAGHAVVAVRLEAEREPDPPETATFRLDFEPAALERFVRQLRELRCGHGTAFLTACPAPAGAIGAVR